MFLITPEPKNWCGGRLEIVAWSQVWWEMVVKIISSAVQAVYLRIVLVLHAGGNKAGMRNNLLIWSGLIVNVYVYKSASELQIGRALVRAIYSARGYSFIYPLTYQFSGCLYSTEWNDGMEWWNGTMEWRNDRDDLYQLYWDTIVFSNKLVQANSISGSLNWSSKSRDQKCGLRFTLKLSFVATQAAGTRLPELELWWKLVIIWK